MSVRLRGKRWVATFYDSAYGNNRWVGTYETEVEARRAEFLARETRARFTWGLEAKGESACRNCSAPALVLHHLVPRKLGNGTEMDNPQFNGLPLCARCHHGWHTRAVRIPFDKLLPEELAFAAGRMGLDWLEGAYPGGGPLDVDERMRDELVVLRAENRRLREFIAAMEPDSKVDLGREQ